MADLRPFVHLHVHSYFSVLDGASPVEDLVKAAREHGQHGMALTDHGVMYGIKTLHDHCNKINKPIQTEIKELSAKLSEESDPSTQEDIRQQIEEKRREIFKPIFGCECYCARNGRENKSSVEDRSGYHLIVLAKNKQGYHNLIKMASEAFTTGFYYKPRIDKGLLEKYHEGLIVSSACLGGEVPQHILHGDIEGARSAIRWFKGLFGEDYYLELQRHKTDKERGNRKTYEKQQQVNKVLIQLAAEEGVKLIATNDSHFANEEDGEAHERLICLSTGKTFDDPNRLTYTKQEWLKSTEEMNEIFADVPEALSNTAEILDKVEIYSIDSDPLMPDFPIPEGFADADDYLRHLSYEGARKRYGEELSDEVKERLDYELGVIKTMGFPGYFLIVQDYIVNARKLGIIVGPGRGSAAGSIVAYSLTITDLDPLRYNLLFERFLNPDRISLPDIDVDFDNEGRQQILEWVTDKYGADHVAHIVTYGTMAAKSSIKDMGRVLQLSLPETNALAKMIPDRIGDKKDPSVALSVQNVPELSDIMYGPDSLQKEVLKYAMQLEGTVRNVGVHACGIIISKMPISDVVPSWVTLDSLTNKDILVTQYDGSVIESTGLIKMDFLGLKTLSIIRAALDNVKLNHKVDIDINKIPLDDELTYKLFSDGDTMAIFQFESPGMQRSLKDLQPSVFEDLIAMVALYRPGPMDNIPSFIARKHGQEEITYELPVMKEDLAETYGITVYQEQVMLLSRKIANFTRGQSDNLRKAMGKKKIKMMQALKVKYLEGGRANGYPDDTLEHIWSEWEKFASYAFNKSHAACYAWVSYQTAYLKAHYPSEYMAGVLSINLSDIAKITKYIGTCQQMGIKVLCPDVNESECAFAANKNGDIRFGLGAIKGFSNAAAQDIVSERKANGPYTDIYDFFKRIPASVATKKTCESLVLSGAFDSFGTFTREDFVDPDDTPKKETFLDKLLRYSDESRASRMSSQTSLFGDANFQEMSRPAPDHRAQPWSDIEKLNREKALLGIYITASPLDKYALVLRELCNIPCSEVTDGLDNYAGKGALRFGGVVTDYAERTSKSGNPYGIMTIQDYDGEGRLFLFGDQFTTYRNFGKEGLYILVTVKVNPPKWEGGRPFREVQSIQLLDQVVDTAFSTLDIAIPEDAITEELYDTIVSGAGELKPGGVTLNLYITDRQKQVTLKMCNHTRRLTITSDFIDSLKSFEDVRYQLS